MSKSMTYETTYPRYPFAPLVVLGIAVAAGLKRAGGNIATGRKTDDRKSAIKGPVGHAA